MSVADLLLDTLEDLGTDDLKTFKWHLSMNVLDNCSPIPKSRLESPSRTDTVSTMIDRYGEEAAVNITIAVLRKMRFNGQAEGLNRKYKETAQSSTSTSSSSSTSSAAAPPAAPGSVTAQQGSVVFAPTISGGTAGSWNITINK